MKGLIVVILMLLFSITANAQSESDVMFMFRTVEKVADSMAQEMGEQDDVLGVKTCLFQCFIKLAMNPNTQHDESTCWAYIKEKGMGDPMCEGVNGKTRMYYLKSRYQFLGY